MDPFKALSTSACELLPFKMIILWGFFAISREILIKSGNFLKALQVI